MSKFVLTAILTIFLGLICLSSVCSSRMAGGWSDLDPNNESVKNVTHFAVDMYNKQSNAINIHQLIAIKSAKSQVVSGRKFEIVFAVGETDCSKNGIQRNDVRECPLSDTKTIATCKAVIWQRVWLNSTILQNIKCCPSETTKC